MHSYFAWISCNLGSEGRLKKDLRETHRTLHPSFSRPGLVTFKSSEPLYPNFVPRSVFAKQWGLSLGKTSNPLSEFKTFQEKLPRAKLHLWRPETGVIEPESQTSQSGDTVFDAFEMGPSDWWWGTHLHGDHHAPWAGGIFPEPAPESSPSRAILKIMEATARFNLKISPVDAVLELGCAPGGMTSFFLEKGCRVVGVDKGEMHPWFGGPTNGPKGWTHIQKAMSQVKPEDINVPFTFLAIDMNCSPLKAYQQFKRFRHRLFANIRGIFFTFKLSAGVSRQEWCEVADLMVRDYGLEFAEIRQLHSNSNELTFVGSKR